MGAGDDEDVVELGVLEGLEDVIAWSDEEEGGEEKDEDGEGGGVEDAEERDAHGWGYGEGWWSG